MAKLVFNIIKIIIFFVIGLFLIKYLLSNRIFVLYIVGFIIFIISILWVLKKSFKNKFDFLAKNQIYFINSEVVSFILALYIIIFSDEFLKIYNSSKGYIISLFSTYKLNNKIPTILETLIHFIISFIISYIFIISIIYYKAIIHSIRKLWHKDPILKLVASEYIDDVLNAQSLIKYTSGTTKIIEGLAATGVELYTYHFAKLLALSASLKPNIVYGCWNTIWYPVNQVFVYKNKKLIISEQWREYFRSLEDVYNKKNKNSKHKRIFIVKNTNNLIDCLQANNKNLEFYFWIFLLKMHHEWNVNEIYFIDEEELERQISDGYNSNTPNWMDFAIFIKKGLIINRKWAFAQEKKPDSNGISNVVFGREKEIDAIIDLFFNEKHPNNVRWHSLKKLSIKDGKVYLI